MDALLATDGVNWQPTPNSPQARAYDSVADVIGYGGAAGGGKTDLMLGKAFTQFHNARIFRRNYVDLADIVERGDQILDGAASFVWGVKRAWEMPDGRLVRLAAVELEKHLKKFQGRPADFIGIDEAAEFPEKYFRYLIGWLRTARPNGRTQILLTFNPPQSAEGEWIIEYFAPWLKEDHPNPAADGELRWYIRVNDEDMPVADNTPVEIDGVEYKPQSRTFYRAHVEDNPHLMATGYRDQLNSLPEPLRSQLLKGDFGIKPNDDRFQVIPTSWILEAQARWERGQRPDLKARAHAVDVARGGQDETTIATLLGTWFDIIAKPGIETPNGDSVADMLETVYDDAPVGVDVVGVGASAYDSIGKRVKDTRPLNAGSKSEAVDKTERYGFANLRSEWWWKMREALDPESGENIALPPIRKLRTDLTAPRYRTTGGKYHVESKDDIYKRIGRSTDYGDAVVMAWAVAHVKPREVKVAPNPFFG